jgi:hypothetical protein
MTNVANFEVISKFSYRYPVVFVNQNLYLLSERTQPLEHYAFICYLPHVSTVSGHHQVDFTTTNMEKHTELEAFLSQLIHCSSITPHKSTIANTYAFQYTHCEGKASTSVCSTMYVVKST